MGSKKNKCYDFIGKAVEQLVVGLFFRYGSSNSLSITRMPDAVLKGDQKELDEATRLFLINNQGLEQHLEVKYKSWFTYNTFIPINTSQVEKYSQLLEKNIETVVVAIVQHQKQLIFLYRYASELKKDVEEGRTDVCYFPSSPTTPCTLFNRTDWKSLNDFFNLTPEKVSLGLTVEDYFEQTFKSLDPYRYQIIKDNVSSHQQEFLSKLRSGVLDVAEAQNTMQRYQNELEKQQVVQNATL